MNDPCKGTQWVCEAHPDKPFGHDDCASAGNPCPCCKPQLVGFAQIAGREDADKLKDAPNLVELIQREPEAVVVPDVPPPPEVTMADLQAFMMRLSESIAHPTTNNRNRRLFNECRMWLIQLSARVVELQEQMRPVEVTRPSGLWVPPEYKRPAAASQP